MMNGRINLAGGGEQMEDHRKHLCARYDTDPNTCMKVGCCYDRRRLKCDDEFEDGCVGSPQTFGQGGMAQIMQPTTQNQNPVGVPNSSGAGGGLPPEVLAALTGTGGMTGLTGTGGMTGLTGTGAGAMTLEQIEDMCEGLPKLQCMQQSTLCCYREQQCSKFEQEDAADCMMLPGVQPTNMIPAVQQQPANVIPTKTMTRP